MSGNLRNPKIVPLPTATSAENPEAVAERIRERLARVPRNHPVRRTLLDWLGALEAQIQERSALEHTVESGVVIDTDDPVPVPAEGVTNRRRRFRRRRVHSVDVVDNETPEGP